MAPAADIISLLHITADPDSTLQAALSDDEVWNLQLQTLAAKAQHWGFVTTLLVGEGEDIVKCGMSSLTSAQEANVVTPTAASRLFVAAAAEPTHLSEGQLLKGVLIVDKCQVRI